jgi:hypothetical protein
LKSAIINVDNNWGLIQGGLESSKADEEDSAKYGHAFVEWEQKRVGSMEG